jgi:hypothetical protein
MGVDQAGDAHGLPPNTKKESRERLSIKGKIKATGGVARCSVTGYGKVVNRIALGQFYAFFGFCQDVNLRVLINIKIINWMFCRDTAQNVEFTKTNRALQINPLFTDRFYQYTG